MRRIAMLSGLFALASSAVFAQVIIMDQIGSNPADTGSSQVIYASQQFEAAFSQFDIGLIDDFNSPGLPLVKIEFVGGIWNTGAPSWNNVQFYRVEFYSSIAAAASNLTGDVASVTVPTNSVTVDTSPYPGDPNQRALVSIPLPNVNVGSGTRWVAVIPRMDFSPSGQTGVSSSAYSGANPGGNNMTHVNPGGGFGMPGNQQAYQLNAAYRITAVPEPASVLALLAGLGLLAGRRKK
jgi:hypothetical protein